MNTSYILSLLIGAVICTGLFAFTLSKRRGSLAPALCAFPIGLCLGTVCSKVLYVLMKAQEQFDNYGLSAFLRTQPAEFTFVGGCVGVVLAICLAARLCKQPVSSTLDAFAPAGALMAAIVRGSTYFLDRMSMVGVGDYVENEALWFFPIAVENEMLFGWFYAVFMLECAFALLCAIAVFFPAIRSKMKPGHLFLHAVFFLALPQIFCEQLLGSYIKWAFVRVEQLLCALIVFSVILYACQKNKGAKKRFMPLVFTGVCMLAVIDLLFMLDNKYLFGLELAPDVCHILMIVLLIIIAGMELWAFRRLDDHPDRQRDSAE